MNVDRDEYYIKMEDLFNATFTYALVQENPLKDFQERVKAKLNYLNNKKYLDQVYHRNHSTKIITTLARAYGSIKTHNMLAKFLYDDLKRGVKLPDSYVKNSLDKK